MKNLIQKAVLIALVEKSMAGDKVDAVGLPGRASMFNKWLNDMKRSADGEMQENEGPMMSTLDKFKNGLQGLEAARHPGSALANMRGPGGFDGNANPFETEAPDDNNPLSQMQAGLNMMMSANRALKQEDMGLVNNYGCWCYFEEAVGRGKGHPVDRVDEICKILHQGYECIMMDTADAGDPCVPWEIPYNSAFGAGFMPFGISMENIVNECEQQNTPGTCASMTCKVEGFFVQSYFTYAIFGGLIDNTKRHSEGFDQSQCATAKAPGNVEEDCCGAFPIRYPYKHKGDGSKTCCGQTTYNPNLFFCCPDENVRLSC